MTYALVTDATIQSEGSLPRSARRLDTGQWVLGLRTAPVELQEACGYFAVTDTARPPDTATTTFDRSLALVDGTPTVVWTERAKTAAELQAELEAANRSTIETNLTADLAAMQAILDSTNASINQNAAQRIKDQARVLRRLVKHALSDYTTAE